MELQKLIITESAKSDLKDVLFVEQQAFGGNDEAELVDNLLQDKSAEPSLSLLAYAQGEAVGHILFTKAILESDKESPEIYILAPLAVIPKYQNKGIGGMLIKRGLEMLKEMNVDIVFVLGHPGYYPKHGFINDAAKFGFDAPYPIPEKNADAWMIHELKPGFIENYAGKVLCAKAMDKPEYWRE
jgi:putative acetyltransferase